MIHVVSFSGGKDSTCMLLMMLDKGMPVDDIIFCDTGMEFPAMYEHIDKVEQYISRKITRLQNPKGFMYYFKEHQKSRGKYMDQLGFGWPGLYSRWCTGKLKTEVIDKYIKDKYIKKEKKVIHYIGIAADEQRRKKDKEYPLINWGITEAMALEYCYSKGFDWGGLYRQFRRVSCWCCPLQPLKELYSLYINYPELWAQLMEMDKYSKYSFKADYTLTQLEKRFILQKENDEFMEKLRFF